MSNYLDEMFIDDVKGCLMSSCSGSGGVEINNQDKTITENGVYTADEGYTGLGEVTVDVMATIDGDELMKAIISRTATEIVSDVETIGSYAFYEYDVLKRVNFPKVKRIEQYTFKDCVGLEYVNCPNVTYIGANAFNGCKQLSTMNCDNVESVDKSVFSNCIALETLEMPALESIGQLSFSDCGIKSINFPNLRIVNAQSFYNCKSLETVILPKLTTSSSNMLFSGCTALKFADFASLKSIGSSAINKCSSLSTLILRITSQLVTLSAANYISVDSPIATGTGYIYVPSALIEDYKAATNWSTYAAQFRALEDYTVDGTTTGALDETKI